MFKMNKYRKISYSQCGEDLIVEFVLNTIGVDDISYLDIGAHHPYYLSNTALFYEKGFRGVCVEPDPTLFKKIKKHRKNDICLNIGIGIDDDEEEADFFIMSSKTLNTFSKDQAKEYESYGNQEIISVEKIRLQNINAIITENFHNKPNFISLDAEGMDFEIIKTFDFGKFRPEVFCIETLTYTEDSTERKLEEIMDLMASNEYMIYADTYINTIFVDKTVWKNKI